MIIDAKLTAFAEALQEGVDAGLHPGAQAYVSLAGQPLLDVAVGESRPGVRMTPDHVLLWMSAGKPISAYLAAKRVTRGLLDLDQTVGELLPAFATGGKHRITIRHLLTHTAGIRQVSSNWSTEPWQGVIDRICNSSIEPDWTPGEDAGYHVASAWYVLVDLCRHVLDVEPTDAAVAKMLSDEVLRPLGMSDSYIGMPRHRYVDLGTDSAITFDSAKATPSALAFPNSEKGHVLCRPGGNARGPARSLGRFYEQLLIDRGDLPGNAILPRDVAREFTTRQRTGLRDQTFKADIDWCLGFLAASPDGSRIPYGYGPHASPATFGHSGNQSSCAFADPAHQLVVVWITTGLPGELAHQKRQLHLNSLIYHGLDLHQ
jgi:CubicO group peptidase (beta-lactamase class C family)